MGIKREREDNGGRARPASKRPKIDPELTHIWEKLANDHEDARLQAAYELLTKHCNTDDIETARVIAKRLFRGLCSSRKGARPGFYVALVGALSLKPNPFGVVELSSSEILKLLEAQSTPEIDTSGQDARDHYFGRLLGAKAIIESRALESAKGDFEKGWAELLDIVYQLMSQKPWLRAEASSIICSALRQLAVEQEENKDAILQSVKYLKKHKLARSIDGLAIWLTVQELLPREKLPQDTWSSGNPLAKSELQSLRKALLENKTADDEDDAQGSSIWSPRLSITWSLLLGRLNSRPGKGEASFEDFWQSVVDNGLFNPASTPERKIIGFLVLGLALKTVKGQNLTKCFTQNLTASVIQSLRSSEPSYLRNVIHKVFADTEAHFRESPSDDVDQILIGLLTGCDYADFDSLTKTRIMQSLLDIADIDATGGIWSKMILSLQILPGEDPKSANVLPRRKNLLSIMQRAITSAIRASNNEGKQNEESSHAKLEKVARTIVQFVHFQMNGLTALVPPDANASSLDLLREKTGLMLEALLASGPQVERHFAEIVRTLRSIKLDAEADIEKIVKESWEHHDAATSLLMGTRDALQPERTTQVQGLRLILSLLLYQVYDKDVESTEMLDEVNSMMVDFLAGEDHKADEVANHIVDVVLSLTSRPSKLTRRVGTLAFEAFAAQTSSEGLQALRDILATKEGREGQQALFENEDGDLSEDDNTSNDGSMDSDVEVMDAEQQDTDASNSEAEASESDETSSDSEADDAEDTELADFESALAAALGTRKLTQDDLANANDNSSSSSDSDSDSDMSDSQMIQLDTKLAEVFRNQQSQTSAQKQRKEELKSAKENVVNLKNRALDLVEIFLRQQQQGGVECAELLTSLLQLARTTGTPQLANKSLDMIKSYVQKSRGAKFPDVKISDAARRQTNDQLLPIAEWNTETRMKLMDLLTEVHKTLAAEDVSNAVIDATAQLNIFICKLLIKIGIGNIEETIRDIAASTGSKQSKRKSVLEFWSRYDAWANSLQQKEKPLVNGNTSHEVEAPAKVKAGRDETRKGKKKRSEKAR